ncbi:MULTISPECIES: metal-sulfur cluster assembly factor [unclassified Streptosporangium]|uniref:metal-sulfur cluster assembly factor n=1 Tax=unclassified Streptosporangium TaxID=2632669 RepID=UPI003442B641
MSKAVETPTTAYDGDTTHDEVMEALKDVVDPELGINVVDLGLIYGLHLDAAEQGGEGAAGGEGVTLPVATIDMTLTSAACPLTDVIEDQAHSALEGMVSDVKINWVWLPPWGPDKITDEGREQLRMLGFNV